MPAPEGLTVRQYVPVLAIAADREHHDRDAPDRAAWALADQRACICDVRRVGEREYERVTVEAERRGENLGDHEQPGFRRAGEGGRSDEPEENDEVEKVSHPASIK